MMKFVFTRCAAMMTSTFPLHGFLGAGWRSKKPAWAMGIRRKLTRIQYNARPAAAWAAFFPTFDKEPHDNPY